MQLKRYQHNPPHLFIDHAVYFITGATYNKRRLFHDDQRKETLLKGIQKWFAHYEWQLSAWIIFSNHYHLVAGASKAADMPAIIERLHGASATAVNRMDACPGRQVWWNYWDTCLRGGPHYEQRLAYIYWNAVKHNIVASPEQYRWSSFSRGESPCGQDLLLDREAGLSLVSGQYDDF